MRQKHESELRDVRKKYGETIDKIQADLNKGKLQPVKSISKDLDSLSMPGTQKQKVIKEITIEMADSTNSKNKIELKQSLYKNDWPLTLPTLFTKKYKIRTSDPIDPTRKNGENQLNFEYPSGADLDLWMS